MNSQIKEDNIPDIVIDLGVVRKKELNESFLAMFGGAIKMLLKGMFGGQIIPARIRGSRAELEAFVAALAGEKKLLQSVKDHGLHNLETYKNKYELDRAAAEFQRKTGIPWPFK